MSASDTTARSETELDHRQRIDRVLTYIHDHVGEPLQLAELARVACFSRFHFHRIFSAYVGETLGEYVRRVRLENAAARLLRSEEPVTDVALAAGYETHAAFTKAFTNHFGFNPSAFRGVGGVEARSLLKQAAQQIQSAGRRIMTPEIRDVPEQKVFYVRRTGLVNGEFTHAAQEAFGALGEFLGKRHLFSQVTLCLGICPDDPAMTAPEACRYDACFVIREGAKVKPEGEVGIQTLPGGRCAVFLHKGPYQKLPETWRAAYRDWLPASDQQLRDAPPYEVYLNDPRKTKPENLLTEIHIPIA
jgi:AraC family transcriptional regulator